MPRNKDNDRRSYLQQLVTEFQDTNSKEYKEQVLANLANFAYDPSNNVYLRQLNVIDLFLDQLTETSDNLVEFAMGGLCNLALDPENKQKILSHNGVKIIIGCLSSTVEETVLSAISTLMFLITPHSQNEITSLPVVDCMLRFSESSNQRLSNLANVFLQDFCSPEKIQIAKERSLRLSNTGPA